MNHYPSNTVTVRHIALQEIIPWRDDPSLVERLGNISVTMDDYTFQMYRQKAEDAGVTVDYYVHRLLCEPLGLVLPQTLFDTKESENAAI